MDLNSSLIEYLLPYTSVQKHFNIVGDSVIIQFKHKNNN